jgi:Ni2+-binding GTPase involved in maturation of urease and hydrogenase
MKLFLTGGFLGSGKTTAIQQACNELIRRGIRVAVITNDQGDQLVDSEFISHIGIPMREVANSCFCCKYPLLEEHMQSLYEQFSPGIIFAESVGSCADLVATIMRPLAKFHPGIPVVLTVFADAQLLWSLMNGDSCFLDESVRYIYKKQLEEADILVINKIDLLGDADLEKVEAILQMEYPGEILLFQNSLQQEDIKRWIDVMNNFEPAQTRKALTIDYDIYGEGEAALAWLDKNIVIETEALPAAAVCEELIDTIYKKVIAAKLPIGHLKFFIDDGAHQQKISYTTKGLPGNAVAGFDNSSRKLSLLINARVQTGPAVLQQIITEAETEVTAKSGCRITVNKLAAFQPGFPRPTHRMAGEEI